MLARRMAISRKTRGATHSLRNARVICRPAACSFGACALVRCRLRMCPPRCAVSSNNSVMVGSSGSGKGGRRETLTFLNSYFGLVSLIVLFVLGGRMRRTVAGHALAVLAGPAHFWERHFHASDFCQARRNTGGADLVRHYRRLGRWRRPARCRNACFRPRRGFRAAPRQSSPGTRCRQQTRQCPFRHRDRAVAA